MKRWLRLCLAVILIVGLFLIVRREVGVRQSACDAAEAARTAGIPEERPPQASPPTRPDSAVEEPEEDLPPPLPEEATILADIDLEALRVVNGDVVGWIMIPGTEVSYPVLQGGDNEYYLDHTWKGEYSAAGSIFMECENDPTLEGFHTILYGHRMKNDSMFGSLKYYSSPEYWQEHPSVYLVTDAGICRYDIFSALEAGITGIIYYLDLTDREEDFIRFCKDNSVIETGIEPEAGDRLLTLSTCTGQGHATRWTVQAVLREIYALS